MHERYWEQNDVALQGLLGQGRLITTPPHEEALARLSYLVEHRGRFGLMLGPAGTGKSLVLNAAAHEAKRLGREVATIELFGIDSHDLLFQLAVGLRLGPAGHWSHGTLWRAVRDHWRTALGPFAECAVVRSPRTRPSGLPQHDRAFAAPRCCE